MSFSNYLENVVLNHTFGKSVLPIRILHVGLGLNSTDQSPNELPTEWNYDRVQTSVDHWVVSTNGRVYNLLPIEFKEAIGGDWGSVNTFLLFDANTYSGGNCLLYGQMTTPWDVKEFDVKSFAAGELEITLD